MNGERLQTASDPRFVLQRELEKRCRSNSRYSLRSFARALGMSPTVLSLVLSGKRHLSRKAAQKVLEVLALSPEENEVMSRWARTRPGARARVLSANDPLQERGVYQMSLDSFAFVSDWHHYAILSLLEIPGARFEPRWIARHLGIPEAAAKGAMERLVRMEIVAEINGTWKQAVGPIRIGNDVPTSATRKFQKQLLLKAIDSLENDPAETRDFSSMTIAMDPAQVPYARQRIRDFRRGLAEELEARGGASRVYEITMQVFPVSREMNSKG